MLGLNSNFLGDSFLYSPIVKSWQINWDLDESGFLIRNRNNNRVTYNKKLQPKKIVRLAM